MAFRFLKGDSINSVLNLSSSVKHALHCVLFLTILITFEVHTGGIRVPSCDTVVPVDPFEKYGYIPAILLNLLKFSLILSFPDSLFNCLGLFCFNAFPEKVQLKGSPALKPLISMRVVTRGDFPELVKQNVNRNIKTCSDVGLENFLFEVVTVKALNLPKGPRIREILIPSTYRTKSGALFKARSLQYCLEDGINILSDTDWIVHLDEDTILTKNSLRGIVNFILDGKYHFGQGMITFANEDVVNWMTTLADCSRVADDMGRMRFQFKIFHGPVFGWKGSFMVVQAGAERKVSFDHGVDGSVSEDSFFGLVAYEKGYTFNFIEGEMWEQSPFTFWDLVQQRKRYLQGLLLIVHSSAIPLRNKVFLACTTYFWATFPLSTFNLIIAVLCPIPSWQIVDFLHAFVVAMNIYMHMFGVFKSISLYRLGLFKFSLCLIGALWTIPMNMVIQNIAAIWGIVGKKHKFYIVNKDVKSARARS